MKAVRPAVVADCRRRGGSDERAADGDEDGDARARRAPRRETAPAVEIRPALSYDPAGSGCSSVW